MRRLICLTFILVLMPASVLAQAGPLTATPSTLTLTGMLDSDSLTASLHLTASESLSDVYLFVSDLTDATGDGRVRDPLPSNAVTLLPAARFDVLPADTLTQIVVQITPPKAAGKYTGTLLIRWEKPNPGELTIPLTVVARTKPALALQNPDQIVISGVRGQCISRRITLRETVGGSPLTGLRVLPQDLITADGEKALSATHLSIDLPADRVEGGGLLTTTLNVDLRGVSPGAYSGQVLFSNGSNGLLALPVTVNVRHGPFWPGLMLVIGVGLGLYLSTYQSRGKPRDELILRVVAVRKAMEDDAELKDSFGSRLDPLLEKAEATIRAEQWEEAKTAAQSAEELVRKWHGGPHAWMKQIKYLRETILPRLDGDALALRKLCQQAEGAVDSAADFDNPSALHDKTLEIETSLVRFETMSQRLHETSKTMDNAPASLANEKEKWQARKAELELQLARLLPDESGWDQLDQDIKALGEEILQAIQDVPQDALRPSTHELLGGEKRVVSAQVFEDALARLRSALLPSLHAGLLLPDAGPFTLEAGQVAQHGLERFILVTYALGGLVLAAVGYSILYLAKPTFGAQPVTDYLALLAWGLGAQATFADVAGLLRGWGIPFEKQK